MQLEEVLGVAGVLGARALELRVGRVRDVDERLVAVAGAQGLGRRHEGAVALGQGQARGAGQDVLDVAGADELRRAQPAVDDLDRLQPVAVEARLDGGVARRRPRAPADAVELVEVGRLPVGRDAGLDAQHLAPVARPRQRPVAVRPRERLGLRRLELLGEVLVVEPRLAAVQARPDDRPDDRGGHHAGHGHRQLVGADALEPQEAGEDDAEQRAVEVGRVGTVLDDGDRVEGAEGHRRRDRVARRRPAPGPEGEQGGERQQRRPAGQDGRAHPLVDPAVGHRDGRRGADPLRHARYEVVPLVPAEHAQRHAGDEQGEDEQDEGHRAGRGAPLPLGPARRQRDQGGAAREGEEQRQEHVAALRGPDQRAPVQAREEPERGEGAQADPLGVRARRLLGGDQRGARERRGGHQATSATRRLPLSS